MRCFVLAPCVTKVSIRPPDAGSPDKMPISWSKEGYFPQINSDATTWAGKVNFADYSMPVPFDHTDEATENKGVSRA